MHKLQRITSEFIETEDRIKFTAKCENEQTLVLWVTQRLISRLIAHSLNWLEKETSELDRAVILDPESRSNLQGIVQQSARQTLSKQTAVVPEHDSQSFLVQEIDININNEGVLLLFKGSESKQAELAFNIQQLRQWLAIIRTLWGKAEWPMSLWPDWMDENQLTSTGGPNSPVH